MGRIAELDYVVEKIENRWTVSWQGQHSGRFATREDALEAAVAEARRVRRLGHCVRLLLRGEDGRVMPASEQPAPAPD